jgi:hypothetical protein
MEALFFQSALAMDSLVSGQAMVPFCSELQFFEQLRRLMPPPQAIGTPGENSAS